MTRKTITHQTWTKCIILRHPFYFTTLPNYDSRLKPSGSSRWSQRFSQALGYARLDSVSLLFATYLDDFSRLQYRYVGGWNILYKRFHLFMDSVPDFYFICTTNPPASLCASRPTFSSEDLFTSVSETCVHHGAIRCCYCPACRTTLVATRFWVAVICPIIQVPHCIRVFFYFVWFVFINKIFNFIMNYVPIVTFWIFTYHKIWILSIMFCFIWSYWIIYFLACLEVSWRVVS